jgi:hypothetical protein
MEVIMATTTKTFTELADEGETVWLRVEMKDFATSQALSIALEAQMAEQAPDVTYLYAERSGEVSIGNDDVALVLTVGGDGVYGELVKARGDGNGNYGTVDVALDLGAEEVRCLVN